jgi:galactokinase
VKGIFERIFHREAIAFGQAPGRVNLMGDHTDYAEGFCLPMPLTLMTDVAMAPADEFRAMSLANGEMRSFDPHGPARRDWTDYIAGPIAELAQFGIKVRPVEVLVRSDVPQGAGVSSSAALEVATLRAFLNLADDTLDGAQLARLAQRAENLYCGMQCGILDQMACALGRPGEALLLDCRTNGFEHVPVPETFRLAVVHCGQTRRLVEGAYNERRAAVEEAARRLNVKSLRDASPDMVEGLDEEALRRRARHVVTENSRVLEAVSALRAGNAAGFGDLMLASHRSLARDFEVSTPALDRLVESAMVAGAEGARLTGAGFGGCIVVLVVTEDVSDWWARVSSDNPEARIIQL